MHPKVVCLILLSDNPGEEFTGCVSLNMIWLSFCITQEKHLLQAMRLLCCNVMYTKADGLPWFPSVTVYFYNSLMWWNPFYDSISKSGWQGSVEGVVSAVHFETTRHPLLCVLPSKTHYYNCHRLCQWDVDNFTSIQNQIYPFVGFFMKSAQNVESWYSHRFVMWENGIQSGLLSSGGRLFSSSWQAGWI